MTPQPWTPFIREGKIVLTGEPMPSEGTVLVGRMRKFGSEIDPCIEYVEPIDLFAPYDGPVYDAAGHLMVETNAPYGPRFHRAVTGGLQSSVTHADLLRDLFHQIDARPNVQLLAATAFPERAKEEMNDLIGMPRLGNLTIHSGPIRTQADLERLATAVLGLRDLCRVGLWIDGPVEHINVWGFHDKIQSLLLTNRNQRTAGVEIQLEIRIEDGIVNVWRI